MKEKEQQTQVPEHLKSLIPESPATTEKLLAAWDSIHAESQIILAEQLPRGIEDRIYLKMLDSPNTYVRYLVAKKWADQEQFTKERYESLVFKKLENDPKPLVQFAYLEIWRINIDDPATLFDCSHHIRLAIIRGKSGDDGSAIANLIDYALTELLPQGKITETEIHELLSDFVSQPNFTDQYINKKIVHGYDDTGHKAKTNITPLWKLVPRLPVGTAGLLIKQLPAYCYEDLIPDEIVEQLTDDQLSFLFYRGDVILKEGRRSVFFDLDKAKEFRGARYQAARHNFVINEYELHSIINKAISERLQEKDRMFSESSAYKDLCTLSRSSSLSALDYAIIHDVIRALISDPSDFYDTDAAQNKLIEILKIPYYQEAYGLDLKLFQRAVQSVSWPSPNKREIYLSALPDPLKFLEAGIKDHDPLATFKAFKELWEQEIENGSFKFAENVARKTGIWPKTSRGFAYEEAYTRHLTKHLPKLYVIEESDTEAEWEMDTKLLKANFEDFLNELRPDKSENNKKLLNEFIGLYSRKQKKLEEEKNIFINMSNKHYEDQIYVCQVVTIIAVVVCVWLVGGSIIHYLF